MFPVSTDQSMHKGPFFMTWILIVLNCVFFYVESSWTFLLGYENSAEFITTWGFVPARFLTEPLANLITVFTALFMHASLGHLLGNMLYLFIFGVNIEDFLGKAKYLVFYLLCGLAATFSQLFMHTSSLVPVIGASGAISGILGANLYLFPKSEVKILIGYAFTEIKAFVVIGFWFIVQFLSQLAADEPTSESGGVAYMAHIGGFLTGIALAYIFNKLLNKEDKSAFL